MLVRRKEGSTRQSNPARRDLVNAFWACDFRNLIDHPDWSYIAPLQQPARSPLLGLTSVGKAARTQRVEFRSEIRPNKFTKVRSFA